ncbi:MAG: molybdopterin converting factor subunit 1 [Ktedonobacterales bacterium]|nr:molybdopterin converting factor subunit 1 [Ktedonobacterales bacterium]
MKIRLRYFAALREALGQTEEALEFPDGTTVAALRTTLATRYPVIAPILVRCVAARNRAFVAEETVLGAGDEVVFIPPMAGGKG